MIVNLWMLSMFKLDKKMKTPQKTQKQQIKEY